MSETDYQPAYGTGTGADRALARAMKQAAESAGRAARPAPAASVSARGAVRRRRVLASAAAGTVCVLASGVVAAVLQFQPTAPALPAAPPGPRHSLDREHPSPPPGAGSATPSASSGASPSGTVGGSPTFPRTTAPSSPPG
ncbi:hypothetical protein [Streptomyces sp. NBC_00388]|uniref:hypothetical protein n=1 Tax=Streptomyces sp. NBC_00388 TaxID=2975735 RepID=UPI002E1F6775